MHKIPFVGIESHYSNRQVILFNRMNVLLGDLIKQSSAFCSMITSLKLQHIDGMLFLFHVNDYELFEVMNKQLENMEP